MPISLANDLDNKRAEFETTVGAKFLCAYLECSDAIQHEVREMLNILADPETDEDDRHLVLVTIAEALFPDPYKGQLGMDLEESERDAAEQNPELRDIISTFDREEEMFANALSRIMKEKGVTQSQLAERVGVGQPAISNMVNRKCRPQKQTIAKLAEGLGVPAKELWPSAE